MPADVSARSFLSLRRDTQEADQTSRSRSAPIQVSPSFLACRERTLAGKGRGRVHRASQDLSVMRDVAQGNQVASSSAGQFSPVSESLLLIFYVSLRVRSGLLTSLPFSQMSPRVSLHLRRRGDTSTCSDTERESCRAGSPREASCMRAVLKAKTVTGLACMH